MLPTPWKTLEASGNSMGVFAAGLGPGHSTWVTDPSHACNIAFL